MNSVVPQGAWGAPPIPPAAEPKKRIAPIRNVIDVRSHMIRVWVECRKGSMKVEDGSRLIHMLSLIQRSFMDSDIEQRLRRLEEEASE